jgi:hypothetical protein
LRRTAYIGIVDPFHREREVWTIPSAQLTSIN